MIGDGLFARGAYHQYLFLGACLRDAAGATDSLKDRQLVVVVDVAARRSHLADDGELIAHQPYFHVGVPEERVYLLLEEVAYLVDGHSRHRDIAYHGQGDVALGIDAVAHHIGGALVGDIVHVGRGAVAEHLCECALGGLCLDADIEDVAGLYLIVGHLHGEVVLSAELVEVIQVREFLLGGTTCHKEAQCKKSN